jgi:hypothetical protein
VRRIDSGVLTVGIAASVLAACGGGTDRDAVAICDVDGAGPVPVVDQIDNALAAVAAIYPDEPEYFEVSADLERVTVIVAVDRATAAERGSYEDGMLTGPEPVGEASGAVFTADSVDFEMCDIFDQVRAELDDPVIIDFAITGGPDGKVVYDATVASGSGGVILVLLGADGTILGAQAA